MPNDLKIVLLIALLAFIAYWREIFSKKDNSAQYIRSLRSDYENFSEDDFMQQAATIDKIYYSAKAEDGMFAVMEKSKLSMEYDKFKSHQESVTPSPPALTD